MGREGAGSEVRGTWEGPGGSVSHQVVLVTGLETQLAADAASGAKINR